MPDENKVLAEFKRGTDSVLRVSLSVFKGRTYVDVRLYVVNDKGEAHPTKKGVTVPPDSWDSFREAVVAAGRELQARKLWHLEHR